eukprot:TRINITY_DN13923_c0_g1_i5.p1 TRINITY_DN13923_c0_g1~~TRINITY_DN13923_c0_g1_i5.p1  ORF type:complete len:321 (-),score=55.49 TRINITY_DN13923_c0_g1_i5:284-1246(-)
MNRTMGYQSSGLKYPFKGFNATHLPNVSERSLFTATPEPHTNTHFFPKNCSMATTAYRDKFSRTYNKSKRKEEISLSNRPEVQKVTKKERSASPLSVPKLDIKVLEEWINTILKTIEISAIPKQLLSKEAASPLFKFGIDRKQLMNFGVGEEMIDRIYRALFVYTIGFHELLKSNLSGEAINFGIISNIWKVYALLLEHACELDYKLLIGESIVSLLVIVLREHKQEIDRIEVEFAERLEKKKETEARLVIDIEENQKYVKQLEKERDTYKISKKRMESEILQSNQRHDEEVKLRLKFESKLNTIYSVHSDLRNRVSFAG